MAQLMSIPFLIGLSLFGLNLIFYSRALKDMQLSVAYPILVSASVLSVFAISYVVLNESFSQTKLIGGVLIIGGIVLISQDVNL